MVFVFVMSLGALPTPIRAEGKPATLNISVAELTTALKPAFIPSGKGIKKFKAAIAENQLQIAIVLSDSRSEATFKYSLVVGDGRLVGVFTSINLSIPLDELSKPGYSPRVVTEIAHLSQRDGLNQRVNGALQGLVQKKARVAAPVVVQSATFVKNKLVVVVLK